MQLSNSLVAEFQKRYRETFGEGISAEKAEIELLSLMELVSITQKPSNVEGHNNDKPNDNPRVSE